MNKTEIFLPSSFQNADRVEQVDGLPLPLLRVKAWVFTDAELLEVKKKACLEMIPKMQDMQKLQLEKWIECQFELFQINP